MRQYLDFLHHILEHGVKKDDRTNIGTISTFGYQMRFDLSDGFPLLTTKRIHMKSVVHELLWFIKGDTNIRYLVQNDVRIWNEWPYAAFKASSDFRGESIEQFVERIKNDASFAEKHGDLGPVYGRQWRAWDTGRGTIDQLADVIAEIRKNPDSRRLIVSAWNPADVGAMALPPCHTLFQFYVAEGKLSCQLYQRSADAFLGVPFNIASYALLTLMVAEVAGLQPGTFVHTFGDCHIYLNHLDQVATQLSRAPRPLPQIVFKRPVNDITEFCYEDIELVGYDPYPLIKGKGGGLMLSLIFAIDPDGVIGKNNDLPWHYPQDLRYFKNTTLHHRVLMGSNTYRSILARLGHALPERENLVATHRPEAFPGACVVTDLDAFLKTPHPDEVFVIGGKTVFEQAWPYADRLYVTHVKARHDGDVRLACFDLALFRTLSVREDDQLIFAVYERIR